jgi:hypothetical protein
MSWELRDGHSYYYRAARRDGQVVKTYVGKGPEGELAARLDARARRERERVAGALKAEQARARPAESATGDFEAAFELIVSAWMHAEGFHRHRSGPWRRRRNHERTTSIE